MGQPHLLRLGLLRQPGGLVHRHMLVVARLGLLAVLAIHALADEQVRARRVLGDHRHRPGVRTIRHLHALSGRPQHHVRRIGNAVHHHIFPFLQMAPRLHRHILALRPLHIETAFPGNGDGIAVTGHIVIYLERVNVVRTRVEMLAVLRQFQIPQFERQFRRDDAQGVRHTLQSSRADHQHRLGPLGVAHGQQQARQAAAVIGMVMGKADDIDRLRTPALLFQGDLGPLAAVDQQVAAAAAGQQRRQPAAGQRHHPAGSQKTYIKHTFILRSGNAARGRADHPRARHALRMFSAGLRRQRITPDLGRRAPASRFVST